MSAPGDLTRYVEPEIDNLLSECFVDDYDGERDGQQRFSGVGRAVFSTGAVYEGQFVRGLLHGRGRYAWSDGVEYEGDFQANRIAGNGKFLWPDGSTYEGAVSGGLRHGLGTFQSGTSPVRYEGQWREGKRHGQGTLYYDEAHDVQYNGEWRAGLRDGRGTMRYPSGNMYEGDWRANKRHGSGTMQWFDRSERYTGEWEEGAQSGQGEHLWIEQRPTEGSTQKLMCNRYVGEFRAGLRHGTGTFFYANGSVYEGEFENNKKEGHGVFTFEDGSVYQGPFTRDRMSGELTRRAGADGPEFKARVRLGLDDLLHGLSPADAKAELRQIDNLLMCNNSELKQIYKHYACLGDADLDNSFTMTMRQFWRFCRDTKIPTRRLPLAALDRLFLRMRQQHNAEVAVARQRRARLAAGELITPRDVMSIRPRLAVDYEPISDDNLHDAQRPILYREWVEALVRISAARTEHLVPPPRLAQAFKSLVLDNVKPFAMRLPTDDFRRQLLSPAVATALSSFDRELQVVFGVYAAIDSSSLQALATQHTCNVREFVLMLREARLIDSNFATADAIRIFVQTNLDDEDGFYDDRDDPDNVDQEMIYSEFVEAVARVACARMKQSLPVEERISRFIGSYLLPNVRDARGLRGGLASTKKTPRGGSKSGRSSRVSRAANRSS